MEFNKYKTIYQRSYIRLENAFDISTLKEIESIAKQHPPQNNTGNDSQYKRNILKLIPNPKISLPSIFLDNVQKFYFSC